MSITRVITITTTPFHVFDELWTPLVLTVKVADDLWTDGGMDGRSNGWM